MVCYSRLSRAIHRYYDTSPFSPTGRYIAVTVLPFEDRIPRVGDVAEVVVKDLTTGAVVFTAKTMGGIHRSERTCNGVGAMKSCFLMT